MVIVSWFYVPFLANLGSMHDNCNSTFLPLMMSRRILQNNIMKVFTGLENQSQCTDGQKNTEIFYRKIIRRCNYNKVESNGEKEKHTSANYHSYGVR